MEQNGLEGLLSHLLITGEDHSNDPEENDIVAGHQYIGRIEILQILGIFRPSQCLEGPECGGEPGIQCVGILCEMRAAALRTYGRCFLGNHDFLTVITVISRNSVSPPVPDIVGPVEVGLLHTLGNQLDLAVLYSLYGGPYQFIHLHEPLLLYQRLNGGLTAVMGTYIVGVILDLYQQSHLVQFFYDRFSCSVTIHSCELAAVLIDGGIVVHHVDNGQVVTLADLKVIGVVGGSDLYHTGTELSVYIGVGNDGNHTVYDRQKDTLSDQVCISLILGMDGHSGIAQHSLGTGGGKGQKFGRAGGTVIIHDGILNVPEMTGLLLIFHLGIGDGGITDRTPVDDTGALVDIAFLVHLHENLGNCLVAALIHGEALSVPVTGRAQLLQLRNDSSAVLCLPLPGSLQEAFSAQIMLIDALLFQGLDDLHLRGDGCMVRTGLPKGIVALHSLETDQNILHGVVQGMSHMELSRNIWRGDHDRKGFLGVVHFCMKILRCKPLLIESVFYALGVIGLCKFFAHSFSPFLFCGKRKALCRSCNQQRA